MPVSKLSHVSKPLVSAIWRFASEINEVVCYEALGLALDYMWSVYISMCKHTSYVYDIIIYDNSHNFLTRASPNSVAVISKPIMLKKNPAKPLASVCTPGLPLT